MLTKQEYRDIKKRYLAALQREVVATEEEVVICLIMLFRGNPHLDDLQYVIRQIQSS